MDIEVNPIVEKGYEHGVLFVSAGPNILRFVPPLVISEAEIAHAVETVGEVLASMP